jgi:hypothetical protein
LRNLILKLLGCLHHCPTQEALRAATRLPARRRNTGAAALADRVPWRRAPMHAAPLRHRRVSLCPESG